LLFPPSNWRQLRWRAVEFNDEKESSLPASSLRPSGAAKLFEEAAFFNRQLIDYCR
jgi:hypothetical protein